MFGVEYLGEEPGPQPSALYPSFGAETLGSSRDFTAWMRAKITFAY